MKIRRRTFLASTLAMTLASRATFAQDPRQLAIDAYIYGYPLVTMEMTRRIMTNVASPAGTRAPMGQFVRMRTYPDASFRDVTAPNADTLYASGWLNVGKEPWVLSLPDFQGRYYLFPMLDAWTDVFEVPGKRTTGTGAQTYAITAPGWKGQLPAGVKQLKSPTDIVWILGRIYCTGTPADYAAVHKLQDQISLVPLSAYGKSWTPPVGKVDPSIDMKTAVREQVNALSVNDYFNLLAQLMVNNPAAAADAPMVATLKQLGVVPGQPFKGSLPADVPKVGFEQIMGHFKSAGKNENGFIFTTGTGLYGTDYLQRALITAIGLGANRPQDAIYPTSETDAQGQPYDGTKNYVMRFGPGRLPPADGFWSLTMYDKDYFFVNNPLNRYTLSQRNDLKKNPDGSIDLYLQNTNPGPERESNWLPTPAGRFILMLRLYWPKATPPSILDGSWTIPPVVLQK